MKNDKPQAKDIDDRPILEAVKRRDNLRSLHGDVRDVPVTLWELESAMPSFPPKVVRSKLGALIKRGLLEGCTCGCRGDFVLTEEGRRFLDKPAP